MEDNIFDKIHEVDLQKTMEKSYIDYKIQIIPEGENVLFFFPYFSSAFSLHSILNSLIDPSLKGIQNQFFICTPFRFYQ